MFRNFRNMVLLADGLHTIATVEDDLFSPFVKKQNIESPLFPANILQTERRNNCAY